MKKTMFYLTAATAAITILSAFGHNVFPTAFLDTAAITAGTIFFHLTMRLAVGTVVGFFFRRHIRCDTKWFRVSEKEVRFYKLLNVRKWKKHVPAYDPNEFSAEKHSWEDILQATCVSEVVHETIMIFSFLPLLAAIPFGAFPAFLTTSVLAAGIDSVFVILQRYNRPRILRMLNKQHSISL